jgi:hypothetical protein
VITNTAESGKNGHSGGIAGSSGALGRTLLAPELPASREVLLVKLANGKVAMRLPAISEPLRKTLPNGLAVIVEHYRDQTARLILPQFSNRWYWLATRKGKPSDLYLKDHLGKKVRNLFYDTKTGTLGSRHELQGKASTSMRAVT